MRDLTVVSQGVPLAVRDFGGVGHPVVLLHGLGRSLVDWSVIGPMLGSSHRTVAFDLRGHGESGDGSWAWAAALADISAVANRLDLGRQQWSVTPSAACWRSCGPRPTRTSSGR